MINEYNEPSCRGTACRASTINDCNYAFNNCRNNTMEQFGKPVSGSLSTIIRSFKSAATKRINVIRNTPGCRLWQRNFYDYIIRDEQDLRRIREYNIIHNPLKWEEDEYYVQPE